MSIRNLGVGTKGKQWNKTEAIVKWMLLVINNKTHIQVDYALLVHSSYSHSQKQQTYICDCVSVTLKANHTHNCHAMLPAHKTRSYNWLLCTVYPLWTGQMGNANNYLVAGRESNPWPSHWWSNVTNYFKNWEDKRTVQPDSNEISDEKQTRWNKIFFTLGCEIAVTVV